MTIRDYAIKSISAFSKTLRKPDSLAVEAPGNTAWFIEQISDRLKMNRGSGKAIIATARKFLGIIYKTLKNDWIFEDFPNFVIANV